MESKVSGHWTDDQIIASQYDVGPEDNHLQECAECQARLAAMRANRGMLEQSPAADEDVTFEFLAAQRRKIYARLTEPARWWSGLRLRLLAPAAAAILAIAGGLLIYEQRQPAIDNKISDAQLAQEVSTMAQDSEPLPTAPLQELFEE